MLQILHRTSDLAGSSEYGDKQRGSTQGGEFLDLLRRTTISSSRKQFCPRLFSD